jgi:hypothetical protein
MKALYALGGIGPLVFLASVILGGARRKGFSHLADPVSALGMSGAAGSGAVNAAWAISGLLIALLGTALWIDRSGPGRPAAAAVLIAGLCSSAIALWCPMDPPGVPMSNAQLGHNILVAVSGLAFAAALVLSARAPAAPPAYRRFTWLALAAMVVGGLGAALSGALGWNLVGLFERVTQSGYHSWIVVTALTGLTRRWRTPSSRSQPS